MLTLLPFRPLVWGQEEVLMANRKPQPYCTTGGRRLELQPGALPRSRDSRDSTTCFLNLSLPWTWAKFRLPRKETEHTLPFTSMFYLINGPLTGQSSVLSGACAPHGSSLPQACLLHAPSHSRVQVPSDPPTWLSQSLCSEKGSGIKKREG